MKVLAINGSPRRGGNTELLIREVFKTLEAEGLETELINIGGKDVNGCTACGKCRKEKDGRCHINNPVLNECMAKMEEADGIILGSPVYFADITPELKALIDVSGYALRGAGNPLRRKVGAGVAVARRAGAMTAFDSINRFFLITEMIIPGSSYWNVGYGKEKGDVLNDEEGLQTMRTLGENMAWLLKKVN
ncbi:flavodoxin family protein [Marinilabilia sp.]|uniref:flavodoxin family protein n=1 Tax=Marinilabilia sp. TaxID=2021252 RepID=UPI0025C370F5|nr:flavodoxin family protein [Marinilabilia sp.]